jgi:hypothetical protein
MINLVRLVTPFLIFLYVCPVLAADTLRISIQSPADNAQVDYRDDVTGTVSNSAAIVWVVIRPRETSDFWVQTPVTVRQNGAWRVRVYFGEAGKHVGKQYEVRAFANPTVRLSEGKRSDWPKAEAQSDLVEVIRR